MCFAAFCSIHLDEVQARLTAFDQARIRRQWFRERQAEKARLWAIVEARYDFGAGIARDIAEWRTEP